MNATTPFIIRKLGSSIMFAAHKANNEPRAALS